MKMTSAQTNKRIRQHSSGLDLFHTATERNKE